MTIHKADIGNFAEDFIVGDVYQHPLGRTITEADSTWFTWLTVNQSQNQINEHYAQIYPIAEVRSIVNSGFTVALVLGMSVLDMSQHAVANLGWTDIKLTAPVYVGDTLYAESKVLEMRSSSSRPDFGILTMRTRGINQDGTEVMSWVRSVMIPKRSSGIGQNYFPEANTGPIE